MAVILNIETADSVCSMALCKDGEVLQNRRSDVPHSHGSLVAVFADELVKFAGQQGLELDAVAISAGPGSYTGLRIGTSFAKGMCYGRNLPLISISTLQIMAAGFLAGNAVEPDTILCPMLDARRMEVYAAMYDAQLQELHAAAPEIVDENSFTAYLSKGKVCFFGNGAEKCKTVIAHPNAIFAGNVPPLAENMAGLAESAYQNSDFANLAYFEPQYLKEFMITKPKHSVIRNLKLKTEN